MGARCAISLELQQLRKTPSLFFMEAIQWDVASVGEYLPQITTCSDHPDGLAEFVPRGILVKALDG
jgi:hypothetical protein